MELRGAPVIENRRCLLTLRYSLGAIVAASGLAMGCEFWTKTSPQTCQAWDQSIRATVSNVQEELRGLGPVPFEQTYIEVATNQGIQREIAECARKGHIQARFLLPSGDSLSTMAEEEGRETVESTPTIGTETLGRKQLGRSAAIAACNQISGYYGILGCRVLLDHLDEQPAEGHVGGPHHHVIVVLRSSDVSERMLADSYAAPRILAVQNGFCIDDENTIFVTAFTRNNVLQTVNCDGERLWVGPYK